MKYQKQKSLLIFSYCGKGYFDGPSLIAYHTFLIYNRVVWVTDSVKYFG